VILAGRKGARREHNRHVVVEDPVHPDGLEAAVTRCHLEVGAPVCSQAHGSVGTADGGLPEMRKGSRRSIQADGRGQVHRPCWWGLRGCGQGSGRVTAASSSQQPLSTQRQSQQRWPRHRPPRGAAATGPAAVAAKTVTAASL
jgi:hypothetical protein